MTGSSPPPPTGDPHPSRPERGGSTTTEEAAPTSAARDRPRRPRWWIEILFVAGFYSVYSLIRSQADADRETAFQHALELIRIERWMGLYHEETLQDWALNVEPLIIALNYAYGSLHFVVTPVVLIFLYRRRPQAYGFWRNVLAITTAVALIGYFAWPLMPPRLLPEVHGFVDTMAQFPTFWDFQSDSVRSATNPYAAMPSLHFGWAAFAGLALWATLERRWGLLLGIGYPALTLVTIVLTGNHFVLDAAGGVAVLVVGFAGAHAIERAAGRPQRGWVPTSRPADQGSVARRKASTSLSESSTPAS